MFRRSLFQVTEPVNMDGSMSGDFKAIADASHMLGVHMYTAVAANLQGHLVGTILRWLALAAAVYLFILDRTNWRTNVLTALLVPYIALNLPAILLGYIRGDIGKWIAFVLIVLRLFFPKHFPEQAELPGALLLLLVTAPNLLISVRFSVAGEVISLVIGIYLLYEHISASGGFRKAFAERGVPVTIGIILLFFAPAWSLFTFII